MINSEEASNSILVPTTVRDFSEADAARQVEADDVPRATETADALPVRAHPHALYYLLKSRLFSLDQRPHTFACFQNQASISRTADLCHPQPASEPIVALPPPREPPPASSGSGNLILDYPDVTAKFEGTFQAPNTRQFPAKPETVPPELVPPELRDFVSLSVESQAGELISAMDVSVRVCLRASRLQSQTNKRFDSQILSLASLPEVQLSNGCRIDAGEDSYRECLELVQNLIQTAKDTTPQSGKLCPVVLDFRFQESTNQNNEYDVAEYCFHRRAFLYIT